MSIELKIKSKHLSVEAKIIRHEEIKLKNQIKWAKKNEQDFSELLSKKNSLSEHRKWDVRYENRATFLARAYIEGTPYKKVEQKRQEDKEHYFQSKVLPRVLTLVKKYNNPNLDMKHIQAWVEA